MKRIAMVALALSMSSALWSAMAIAQLGDVNGGVGRQTTRQISDAIAARILQSQADVSGSRPGGVGLSLWHSFAYNHGSGDFGLDGADADVDTFQNILGADWAFERFYLGVALSHTYGEFDGSISPSGVLPIGPPINRGLGSSSAGPEIDFSFDANGYTVSPFAAWIANEHFFVNFMAGYELIAPTDVKRRVGGFGCDVDVPTFERNVDLGREPPPPPERQEVIRVPCTLPDTHTGFYEIDLNAVWADANLSVPGLSGATHRLPIEATGRVGFRHELTWFSGSLDHFYTFIAGGDVGVRIGIVKPYLRAWYEGTVDNDFPMDHAGFAGGGVAVEIREDVVLDIGGWTNFGDPHIENVQASLSLRVKF